MQRIKTIVANHLSVILLSGLVMIYGCLALVSLPSHWHVLNPDGVSYLSIAQYYYHGNWEPAINGYWGPLYSWLIAGSLLIIPNSMLAAKLLGIGIGAVLLIGSYLLAGRLTKSRWRLLPVAILVLPVVDWALTIVTPDLLMTTVLVYLFYALTSPRLPSWHVSALVGVLGGLLYLTKSYGFTFFMAGFTLYCAYQILSSKPRSLRSPWVISFLTGMLAFAIVAAPWIGTISHKYHKLTFGTAASYNWALIGPQSSGHPMNTQGFLAPSNSSAISAWEDPSNFKLPAWQLRLGSPSNVNYYLNQVILPNINLTLNYLQQFTGLAWALLLLSLLLLSVRGKQQLPDKQPLAIICSGVLIYVAGYWLVLVEARYITIVVVLLSIIAMLALSRTAKTISPWVVGFISLAVLASFWAPAAKSLHDSKQAGRNEYNIAMDLKKYAPGIEGATTASNTNWGLSLYTSYYLGDRYYGVPAPGVDATGYYKQMADKCIEYYFQWGVVGGDLTVPDNYKLVYVNPVLGLRVYKL